MYDVITCGSATLDVYAQTDAEFLKVAHGARVDEMMAYKSGSKILISDLHMAIGGGGTNTAVAFDKCGLKTGYIGCIGSGENARTILNLLKKEHITFLGHTSADHSGYSIILDARGHDRTILTHKGANNSLDFAKLTLRKTKWFYFSSMMGKSFVTQKKIASWAKSNGSKIAFNPSSYQVKEGLAKLRPLLKLTDVLIFNKEEAELLTRKSRLEDVFAVLHKEGVSIVVITNGSGCVYASCGETYVIYPKKIKVVEATGAGDAFAAGFVTGLIMNLDLPTCLQAGMLNSHGVIAHYGAKGGLLTRKELLAGLKKKPFRMKKVS